ncbi:hypothetical protein [Microbacterium sp. NPDC076911]|uniref:hypothetical protein n=1 Tax=Microbacterium sp. NPDC076911 TaxID=3154958 RepID=UPI003439DD3F
MTEIMSRPEPPARPSLESENAPPILAKLTPPFSVRVSQLFWILSFIIGGSAVVYSFIIRETQLPLIADLARTVEADRDARTYTAAADIIYWSMFALMVAVILVQITLLVSFMARKPNVRWWQLLTFCVQVATFSLGIELVITGEQAQPLRYLVVAQCALVLLALFFSILPGAMRWSARKRDVVRLGADGPGSLD